MIPNAQETNSPTRNRCHNDGQLRVNHIIEKYCSFSYGLLHYRYK
jgi:hypothetical protein